MVMKTTKYKHLLRTIRKSGVSFFAVAFIAATSIAIFLGMLSSGKALLARADRYFQENHLAAWQISCANGITQEDVDAIAGWEDVSVAEGGYSDTARYVVEGEKTSVAVVSLGEELNQPLVLEGELPQGTGEVAVEQLMAQEKGLAVGDTITLEQDGFLKGETFQVTAIINQPAYCTSGTLDARGTAEGGLGSNEYYVMVDPEAFDGDYYSGCYTTVFVDTAALEGVSYYSDSYDEIESQLREQLEAKGEERAQLRYDTLMEDGQSQIGDAQTKIDDAQAEIDEAQAKIDDGEAEIADNQAQLDDSLSQLQAQLAALGLSTDLDEAEDQLGALGAAGAPLQAGIDAWREGNDQLEEAKAQLDDAREEVADGQAELEDARAELADAEEELADVTLEDWVVSSRSGIGDVRGVEITVSSIYALSVSLSLIFLVVAALVCYAAITRMIDEQRVIIGTQKAVGFTAKEILRHYMLYNFMCALLGILIGWVASVVIVEVVVIDVYQSMLLIGSASWDFAWGPALLAAGLCMVIFLGATYFACSKLVKVPATLLLKGEVPEKEKNFFFANWGVYKRLSLYSRTMIKNVLSDKGRMLTTISGLMGCVALLIISFAMKFGNENSSELQFDKYFFYNDQLVFDSSEGSAQDFAQVLEDNGVEYLLVQEQLERFRVDGGDWETCHVLVVDDPQQLEGFVRLDDAFTGETLEVPEDGMLVSRKCAESMDLEDGSSVELMDDSGSGLECQVSGVFEHYLRYHLFITTRSYWESAVGDADFSVFLLKGDVTGLLDQVKDLPGFLFLQDSSEVYASDASSLNGVIAVCVALSMVMVLLVLLNQITMYINRKSRELAVMRVNGYTMQQTRAYIYKDNIVLTILGILLGWAVGLGLGYLVVWITETGASRYIRLPDLTACLLATVIVGVMAVIVNLIALRKIKHLNLTNVSSN